MLLISRNGFGCSNFLTAFFSVFLVFFLLFFLCQFLPYFLDVFFDPLPSLTHSDTVFVLFIYHFLMEIASLKLNMKVCDAIPGTLYVVSEENAAINENHGFTERFNFELAFNLPLTKLFKAYL